MGNGRGVNGLFVWRRRVRIGVRSSITFCICRKGDCCRSIISINKEWKKDIIMFEGSEIRRVADNLEAAIKGKLLIDVWFVFS